MSEKLIRAALEKRLNALTPSVQTAYENQNFTPPSALPYQRVNLMRAQPENPAIGDGVRQHIGFFQVTLFYPQGAGPGAAEARADLLAAWFPRKLSLVEGGVVVTVDGTPHIMAGFADGDRWAVPVRVPYFSNISS